MSLWSRARYDLHLSDDEFFHLTPRQLSSLLARHRESLVHREMVSALTTAAVINHGAFPPKEYVPWSAFSPHHTANTKKKQELTEAQLRQVTDHNTRVLEMVAKMKAEAKHD